MTNVANEDAPSINMTTVTEITAKYNQYKASGMLEQLADEKIRIPIMTKAGRVLYLPLLKLTVDDNGSIGVSNIKKGLPYPLAYLRYYKLDYRPATPDEVQDDQKRLSKGFNTAQLNKFMKSLTFLSNNML